MKSKKFLSIICALIMMFCLSIAIVDAKYVSATEDTKKVVISNEAGLMNYIKSQGIVAKALSDGHIAATATGATCDFPAISKEKYDEFVQESGETVDTFETVKIQVGYKNPTNNGDYVYSSGYSVSLNKTGTWYFVYKFTDAAGNATITDSFSLRVFDETAPVLTVTESVKIVVDEQYAIPSASFSDNASDEDTRYKKWTLYSVDANGNRTEVKNVKYGEDGYDESMLKDGKLTPAEAGSKFVVVYESQDKAGNKAQNVEMAIEVIEATPDYVANPFNDFVKTALIVVACLAGLGIIILIFVKPRERSLK